MARPGAARTAAPRDTRTTRSGLRRTAYRAPEVGAHRRTRRSAGAELAARRLTDGVRRYRLRRPRHRPRGAARARPRPRRHRQRPLAPAPPLPARAALRRHGGLPGPHGPGRPRHDVHLCLRAGVPGRRSRGARPARSRAALVAGPPAGRGPGGRLRQLAAGRERAHRLALDPSAAVDADRRGPRGRACAQRRPAGRLGAARAGRAGDVRTARPRPLGRPGRPDVP